MADANFGKVAFGQKKRMTGGVILLIILKSIEAFLLLYVMHQTDGVTRCSMISIVGANSRLLL